MSCALGAGGGVEAWGGSVEAVRPPPAVPAAGAPATAVTLRLPEAR